MLPGTVRCPDWAPPATRALLSARISPYFGISSSRAGQPLLTDSLGDLPRPLLAGCIFARHTVGGRGRDGATGQGVEFHFWQRQQLEFLRSWSYFTLVLGPGSFRNVLPANTPL